MERKTKGFIGSFKMSFAFVLALAAVYSAGLLIPIDQFGIRPRSLIGLPGILVAPFMHVNPGHLLANSFSFLVLGTAFFMIVRNNPAVMLMHFAVIGGLGTWLIGRPASNHIGLSGVLYGIIGYFLSLGFFRRKLSAILISVACFVVYGGALWGILPGNPRDSWESHLCGLLAGIITAWYYSRE